MKLSNKAYDVLKYIVVIALPALAAFYLTLGQLWGLPETERVAGSITSLDAFLGILLQVSANRYNKDDANYDGYIDTGDPDEDTGIPEVKLVVTKHPDEIVSQKVSRLKVGPAPKPKRPIPGTIEEH